MQSGRSLAAVIFAAKEPVAWSGVSEAFKDNLVLDYAGIGARALSPGLPR
jgi:hypothetical protein